MSSYGSPMFEAYTRIVRRIYWADFIDAQIQAARGSQFKASLVEPPLKDTENLTATYDFHRRRGFQVFGD